MHDLRRSDSRKIIFINRYFWPDIAATSQMLSDLAIGLTHDVSHPPINRRASQIVIITSRMLYQDARVQLSACETHKGVDIRRVWTSRFGRSSLVGRALDYASFYMSAGMTLLRSCRKGDIVVAMTDPPLMVLVAYPIARMKGARIVTWMQDVFPEVAEVERLGGRILKPVWAMARGLRDHVARRLDSHVVIGQRMATYMEGRGVDARKITIIPNWSDPAIVSPVAPENNELRRAWGLSGKFVVAYSGNLGRAHDIDTMLSAITITERAFPGTISWLFVGGGAQFEKLRNAVNRLNFMGVHFKPYQAKENLAQSLAVADVHLVSLRPAMEGLIVPSKVYGILAAARPCLFIGDRTGEVARMISEFGCGETIAEGDGPGLAALVVGLTRDPTLVSQMGARGRAAFEARFQTSHGVAAWRDLLTRLSSSSLV